jgi:hypothetical protein
VYNLNNTPTILGYKAEEKLHLGVHEQKCLNGTGVEHAQSVILPSLPYAPVPVAMLTGKCGLFTREERLCCVEGDVRCHPNKTQTQWR